MPSLHRTVLLTGERGVGKTTALLRLRARALAAGLRCGGFLTLPIVDTNGRRLGLDLCDTASGERRRLASCLEELDGPRIGPYSMRGATLAWGIDLVGRASEAAELLLVDEIGPLELARGEGFAPLRPLLSRHPGALLIAVRPSLVEQLATEWIRPGARRFEVTMANRRELPSVLLRHLSSEPASEPWRGVS